MIGSLFRTHRSLILIGLLGNIIGMTAELTSPLFIGFIIDAVIAKDKQEIERLVMIWLTITISSSVINGLQSFLMNYLTHKIGNNLRQDIFKNIMLKDIEFFDQNKTGKLMSTIQNDCQKIEQALSTQIALVLKSTIFCMTVLIIIFIISWRMTLFMIAVMIPLFIYAKFAGGWFRKAYKKISDASAKVSEVSQECFGNIRTVKAFGTEDYQSRVNEDKLNNLYQAEKDASIIRAVHEFMMTGVMFSTMDAIIWFSSYLYFNYGFSIGKINSFNSYLFSILINFAMLSTVITEVIGMFGTMANIAEIILYEPAIKVENGS